MKLARDPTPRSPFRFLGVLWATGAAFLLFSIAMAAILLAERTLVTPSQSFIGTLRPNQEIIPVSLPAGLPVKSVLVEAGDVVRAGQTVVLLDSVAIQEKLRQLERNTVVARVLRECLLYSRDPAKKFEGAEQVYSEDSDQTSLSLTAETNLLVRAALSECGAQWQAEQVQKKRLSQGLKLLQAKLRLTEQKIAMVLATAQEKSERTEVHPFARAHAGIELSLEKNDLQRQHHMLNTELLFFNVEAKRARLARIAELSEDVARMETRRVLLNEYFKQPRLKAPEEGTVDRIRPIMAGAEFPQTENLIELRGPRTHRYFAELKSPLNMAKDIEAGRAVQVTLLGFPGRGPTLQGHVTNTSRGENTHGTPFVVATVELTDESESYLSNPENGIALRGRSTASSIAVNMKAETLVQLVKKAVSRNFPKDIMLWRGVSRGAL